MSSVVNVATYQSLPGLPAIFIIATYAINIVGSLPTVDHSKSFSNAAPNKDYDQTCQNYNRDYVWDKALESCVPCGSCRCYNTDPHCMKCRDFGILQCGTPTVLSTQPQMTSLQTTTESAVTSAMTTLMPTTRDGVTSPDGSTSKVAWGTGLGVTLFLLVLLGGILCVKYKPWQQKKGEKELKRGKQDTQPPAVMHPMIPKPTEV